ncbi:MAG TPA: hypothetical protein PK435_12070 [Thermoanaerobaculaceae bacterium]|nr:hypothetical protein [Thermoanaerobaculaceae bacterium]
MVERVVFAAAETRSFARAELALEKIGGTAVSANTVQRVVGDVGAELAARRDAAPNGWDALARRPEEPPELAVVECDGGRARTREPGHGRGVHLSGEGWRETKNACLVRALRKTFADDPQPEPPACFCDPKHAAKIAETEAFSVAAPRAVSPPNAEQIAAPCELLSDADRHGDWRPKRLVRTVVSSMKSSRDFGRPMAKEAKQRRFFEAIAKAFLGDGLPWNWTIWKEHFRDFIPILDFIHPLSYLFLAAKTVHPSSDDDGWNQYLVWMRGCWQGEVGQVLDELRVWQSKLGEPPSGVPDCDPRKIVAGTMTYLENNRPRMNYPEYRKAGLPVTTAWMESLVKEVNYRVKGTEMFWNNPEGAEAILQVRAAALSDDDRLSKYLHARPGCAFTRRPKSPKAPAEICKS